MTQYGRMKANLPYKAWLDGLAQKRMECKKKIKKYNDLEPDDEKGREELLRSILGKAGRDLLLNSRLDATTAKIYLSAITFGLIII